MQNMCKNYKKVSFLMKMETKFHVMEIQDWLNQFCRFTTKKEGVLNTDKCCQTIAWRKINTFPMWLEKLLILC